MTAKESFEDLMVMLYKGGGLRHGAPTFLRRTKEIHGLEIRLPELTTKGSIATIILVLFHGIRDES